MPRGIFKLDIPTTVKYCGHGNMVKGLVPGPPFLLHWVYFILIEVPGLPLEASVL